MKSKQVSQGEIILYKVENKTNFQIEVRVEDENVWLNRHQMALLFNRDVKTIGKHITNALKEELRNFSVVAKFATTASDGKTYQVEHYSLDMIISVGYRVKSERGVQFRIWANKILKDFLLKGYSVNQRIERIENDVHSLKERVDQFNIQINANLPPNEGIFYDGQIFDAHIFVSEILKSARESIIIIDNYVDEGVLLLLTKREIQVTATIYTKNITKQFLKALTLYNTQYPRVTVEKFSKSHDRFLIIDGKTVYHIGASLKDLGKKWFAFSKMEIGAKEIIDRLR
ncbi:MAG: RhuM family protein [Bacteroidales bacterium]|nr:RhuM family protein [Bacteroidales bacterium]